MFLKKIFDPYTGTEKKSRICIVRASIHSSVGNSIPTSENRSSENSGVNTRSLIGVLIAGDKTESMVRPQYDFFSLYSLYQHYLF